MTDPERLAFLQKLSALSPPDIEWLAQQRVTVGTILKAELIAATVAGHDCGSFEASMVDEEMLVTATDQLDREGFAVRAIAGQVEVGVHELG